MSELLQRLSIRSVSNHQIEKLNALNNHTRLPMALLFEDAVELLWDQYLEDGHDLPEMENVDRY